MDTFYALTVRRAVDAQIEDTLDAFWRRVK
jgi:hypothetical protein